MGARFFGVDNAFAINKLIQNRGLKLKWSTYWYSFSRFC